MSQLETESISPALEGAMDDVISQMGGVHGPYWESRLDVSKSVLTITAAVLVGTISFSSSLIGPGKNELEFVSALILSWVFLMFSGAASIYALWHIYKLNSRHVLLNNVKPTIEKELNLIGARETEETLKNAINEILGKMIDQTLQSLATSDKHSHYALATQFSCFALGLFSFLVFGIVQVV